MKQEIKDEIAFLALILSVQIGYIFLCTALLMVTIFDFREALLGSVICCTFNINFIVIMWLHYEGYYKSSFPNNNKEGEP